MYARIIGIVACASHFGRQTVISVVFNLQNYRLNPIKDLPLTPPAEKNTHFSNSHYNPN